MGPPRMDVEFDNVRTCGEMWTWLVDPSEPYPHATRATSLASPELWTGGDILARHARGRVWN